MLAEALTALKQFDWGTDLAQVSPIDDAVAAAHGKPDDARTLESQLVALLGEQLSRDAKDYVCRKLAIIGSSASVPALAALVTQPEHSHMARFALEQISGPAAAQALRDAAAKTTGDVRIGMLSSLGARRDGESISLLKGLLANNDRATARAAALALGAIGNAAAAQALQQAVASAGDNQSVVFDALFSCAEAMLAAKQVQPARAIYQTLAGEQQPRLTRLAATRGILACSAQQA